MLFGSRMRLHDSSVDEVSGGDVLDCPPYRLDQRYLVLRGPAGLGSSDDLAYLGEDSTRRDDIAGFATRRLPRLDVDPGVGEGVIVQFTPCGSRGANCVHVGSWGEPF